MSNDCTRSCVDCGLYHCFNQETHYPEFCVTTNMISEDMIAEVEALYQEPENKEISRVSAELEHDFYCRYTRVEEIIAFCKRMGYKRIGIATCIGLIEESRIFARILRKNGLEPIGAVCKIASMSKDIVEVPEEKTTITGQIMCNPIMQAKVMNAAETDINVVVGLCVGHDSLFFKYSEAICTTLVTKDRVLGHNPVAGLYQAKQYYKKLSNEEVEW